jgi:hypothetical protein
MQYKNITDSEQVLVGVGLVKPGESIEVEGSLIGNPNFELAQAAPTPPVAPVSPVVEPPAPQQPIVQASTEEPIQPTNQEQE